MARALGLAGGMKPGALGRGELSAWLRLAAAPGLSAAGLSTLLAQAGPLETLLGGSHTALSAYVGRTTASALLAPPGPAHAALLDRTLAWLDAPDQTLVTRRDPRYPDGLAQLYDAPPLLYVKGDPTLLGAPALAVIGSRDATAQGEADAAFFSAALARAGLTVVSGLARGIDGAAHRGALNGPGSTIAVLGTGADQIYPACHASLARAVAAQGALVSEWPLGTPPRAAHFPQRNRLIAGLARGVLVVEAAQRSGSLITARLANELGRDVFALPGSIHAPLARGCHVLIRDGAKLVECVSDILEEYGLRAPPDDAPAATENASAGTATAATGSARARRPRRDAAIPSGRARGTHGCAASPAVSPEAQRVLSALGHTPAPLDLLIGRTGLGAAALHPLLLELELAGKLVSLPGGRFARLESPAA